MTAPLPAAGRLASPWDGGFVPFGADQLAALDAEIAAFEREINASRRPSPAALGVLAVIAVFTQAGRHLRRLLAGPRG